MAIPNQFNMQNSSSNIARRAWNSQELKSMVKMARRRLDVPTYPPFGLRKIFEPRITLKDANGR